MQGTALMIISLSVSNLPSFLPFGVASFSIQTKHKFKINSKCFFYCGEYYGRGSDKGSISLNIILPKLSTKSYFSALGTKLKKVVNFTKLFKQKISMK